MRTRIGVDFEIIPILADFQIGDDGSKLSVKRNIIGVFDQTFCAAAFDKANVLEHVVDVTILNQQVFGGLFTDTWHAFDPIRAVAHER